MKSARSKLARSKLWRGRCRLIAFTIAGALVWLWVLPRLATLPSQKRYLDRLDDRGIDAGAMFYTELPPEMFLDHVSR